MQISKGIRRKLRSGLGTRAVRRTGTKSRIVGRSGRPAKPATRLKTAIKRWNKEQNDGY